MLEGLALRVPSPLLESAKGGLSQLGQGVRERHPRFSLLPSSVDQCPRPATGHSGTADCESTRSRLSSIHSHTLAVRHSLGRNGSASDGGNWPFSTMRQMLRSLLSRMMASSSTVASSGGENSKGWSVAGGSVPAAGALLVCCLGGCASRRVP